MAQDVNTQPQAEALQSSSQPSVKVRDLDSGGEDGVTKTPEEMVTPKETIEDPLPEVEDSPSDDLRKQLEELREANDNLKKGLYDKGREMKQLKEALTRIAPESEQQMIDDADSDDELEAAAQVLRNKGFLTTDVLESFEKRLEQKGEINQILTANPQIDKDVLDALMAREKNLHVYDVIEKYKRTLLGDQALQKAHNRPLVGEPIAKEAKQDVPISQMSDDEFNLLLKKNSKGSRYL